MKVVSIIAAVVIILILMVVKTIEMKARELRYQMYRDVALETIHTNIWEGKTINQISEDILFGANEFANKAQHEDKEAANE